MACRLRPIDFFDGSVRRVPAARRGGYLLDCQSDLLAGPNTCFVVPLLAGKRPLPRLRGLTQS